MPLILVIFWQVHDPAIVKDLGQELINKFMNQNQNMQHMNGGIRRIIQSVVCPVICVRCKRIPIAVGKTIMIRDDNLLNLDVLLKNDFLCDVVILGCAGYGM